MELECRGGRRDASTVLSLKGKRSVCQACARGEGSAVEMGRREQALIVAEPASADDIIQRSSSRAIGGNHAQLFPAVTKVNWTAMRL